TIHIADVERDPRVLPEFLEGARTLGFRRILFVPMHRARTPLGTIGVAHREPGLFSESQIALLKTFADQAVIAIENVRLFTELQSSNRELTAALDKQTATSDILRVISSSPTDVQPVFDTIANSAMRLCDGNFGNVATHDGDLLHLVAHANVTAEGVEL